MKREMNGEIVKGEALFIGKTQILFYLSFTILPLFYYFTYYYYYTYHLTIIPSIPTKIITSTFLYHSIYQCHLFYHLTIPPIIIL